jgi:hypothetical protein
MMPGRPFRALTFLLAAWVGARVLFASAPIEGVTDSVIDAGGGEVARLVLPGEAEAASRGALAWSAASTRTRAIIQRAAPAPLTREEFGWLVNDNANGITMAEDVYQLASYVRPSSSTAAPTRTAAATSIPKVGTVVPTRPDRWSASTWAIARNSFGPQAIAPGGSLGGSQAGTRVLYKPGLLGNRLGLFARTSSPMRGLGSDVAFGAELQPFAKVPVRMALEQRFPLDRGGARGTALSLIGGVSDLPVTEGVRLNAYAQAGVLGVRRRIGFADGAVTLNRPVAKINAMEVGIGAGSWGAVQPGLSRLDAGPRVELKLPVAGRPARVGLEYRHRLLGNANPGSGAAITVGSDF